MAKPTSEAQIIQPGSKRNLEGGNPLLSRRPEFEPAKLSYFWAASLWWQEQSSSAELCNTTRYRSATTAGRSGLTPHRYGEFCASFHPMQSVAGDPATRCSGWSHAPAKGRGASGY